MRKQLISSFVGLVLLGMGTQISAQQQGRGWEAGLALPVANEALGQWTKQPLWGLCVDGAYVLPVSETGSAFRLGLGVNWLPGKEGDFTINSSAPRTISLTGFQINADFVVPLSTTQLSIVTGLSLNTWMKSVSGKLGYAWGEKVGDAVVIHPAGTLDNDVSGVVKNAFGKYGLRLGLEYALNENTIVSALFQMTELGTDLEFIDEKFKTTYSANGTASTITQGKKRVLPSWVQFGVRYKF